MSTELPDLITPDWDAPSHIRAFTTTRKLASSSDPVGFGDFNLGDHVGDDLAKVSTRRKLLLDSMEGCNGIIWLKQVHGTECINPESVPSSVVTADASATDTAGIACAVMTADCLPVLFCDRAGKQVAAAHAGWKGLADGVLLKTLERFPDPRNVLIWFGPAISQSSFETGPEVLEAFSGIPGYQSAFRKGDKDRWYADLYELARLQLQNAGVETFSGGGLCTFSDPQRFYSYRRDQDTGRMVTCIWRDR